MNTRAFDQIEEDGIVPRSARTVMDLRSLARSHTAMAVQTLASVAASKRVDPKVRIDAADILLTRGWGKPDNGIANGSGEIRVIIRQIVENVNDPKVIEHDSEEQLLD